MPGAPERRPGLFIVDLDGAMIGQIILRRATGHGPPAAAGEAELGYLFLPEAWGFGYAAEACAAALGWFAGELPGEPVVLFTQTANARSMRLAAKLGFTEVERFEAYGADQTQLRLLRTRRVYRRGSRDYRPAHGHPVLERCGPARAPSDLHPPTRSTGQGAWRPTIASPSVLELLNWAGECDP